MIIALFWAALALLVYTYVGYPALIGVASLVVRRPVRRDSAYTPSVSVVIAVFNEERHIEQKISNILAQDYPADKLELLIGSDASTDATDDIARAHAGRVRLFSLKPRQGKPGVLNHLVPQATGDLIVFADARQRFETDAIRELAANFNDERVGCVSGELVLEGGEGSAAGHGLGLYWTYEKRMRGWESGVDSMLGATGAIYAIRRELYEPIPSDTLLDDMLIPLTIARRGYRCLFEPRARAYDRVSMTLAEESRRKIRTLAGNVQLFVTHPSLINPFSHRIAWQLLSHKLLRILAPYVLVALLLTNAFAAAAGAGAFYRVFLSLQVVFYLLALAGALFPALHTPLVAVPRTFCHLNIDAVRGALSFFGTPSVTWKK